MRLKTESRTQIPTASTNSRPTSLWIPMDESSHVRRTDTTLPEARSEIVQPVRSTPAATSFRTSNPRLHLHPHRHKKNIQGGWNAPRFFRNSPPLNPC